MTMPAHRSAWAVGAHLCVTTLCVAAAGAYAVARAQPVRPVVHVVYFTPADREPLPGYRDRLDRIMSDVREFYRREMERNGHGPITFPLERDADGALVVRLVKSGKAYKRGEAIAWDDVVGQVNRALRAAGVNPASAHAVIFQNLVFREGRSVSCWAPYAGLGDHRQGRACVTDHPDVDPPNLARTQPVLLVNGGEQPLNQYVMAHLGGVAHELGHGLGLPHNMETPEEGAELGTALMGRGNYTYGGERAGRGKGSFVSRASALILSRHPLFRGDDHDADKPPNCTVPRLSFTNDAGKIAVTGEVKADVPVTGLAVYLDPLPARSDYDAASWVARVGADGSFHFDVARQVPGYYEIRLRFCHQSGAQSVFAYPYRLTDSADPPVAYLGRQHAYGQSALPAYERRDKAALAQAVERLDDEDDIWSRKAKLLAAALDRPRTRPAALSEVKDDVREVMLSAVRWESAKGGWAYPMRDLMSDSGYLMESGDAVHATGLYAHASSCYVYQLDGKWTRFEAGCGLQNWVPGTVSFTVKGDGRVLWQSGKIGDWAERAVSVGVAGVHRLELIAEPTDDGQYADCAMWFSPRLKR